MEFPFRRSTSRDNYNEESTPQPLRALRNSISEGSSSLFDSMKGAKNGLFGGISSKFDQVLKRGDSGTGFSAQDDTRSIPNQRGAGGSGGGSPKVSSVSQEISKPSPPMTPPTSVSSGGSPQPLQQKGVSPQQLQLQHESPQPVNQDYPKQAEPSPAKPKPKPPRPTRGPSLDRSTYVRSNGTVRRGSADSDRSYDGQDVSGSGSMAISFDQPLYGKQTSAENTPKTVHTNQEGFFSDDVFASVTKGIENLNANIPDDEAILNKSKRPNVSSHCDPPSAKFTNVPHGADTTNFERPSGAVSRSNPFMSDTTNDPFTSHPSDPPQMALSSSGSAFEPVVQTISDSTTVNVDVHNARSPDKSRLSIDLSSEGDDPNIASLLGADLLPGIPRIPGGSGSSQSSLNPGPGRDLLAITPTMTEVLPKPDIEPAIVPKDDDSDAASSATEGCDEIMEPADIQSPDRHNDYLFRTGSVGSDKSWSSSYSNESQMDELSVQCMHFMKSFVMKIFDLG